MNEYVHIRVMDVMNLSHLELDFLGCTILMTSAAVGPSFTFKLCLLACYSKTIQLLLLNQDHLYHLRQVKIKVKKNKDNSENLFSQIDKFSLLGGI